MAEHKRSFSAAEKAKIIREGMAGTRPITEVCRHYGITATQYYDWQKRFLDGATSALENRPKNGKHDKQATALSKAEEKIAKLHRVITEITLENIDLKKNAWGLMGMERYDEPLRQSVIDLVDRTRTRSGWPVKRTLQVLGIAPST